MLLILEVEFDHKSPKVKFSNFICMIKNSVTQYAKIEALVNKTTFNTKLDLTAKS